MFESAMINYAVGVLAIALMTSVYLEYKTMKRKKSNRNKEDMIDFSGGKLNLK